MMKRVIIITVPFLLALVVYMFWIVPSQRYKVLPEQEVDVGGGVKMKFVLVPRGEFIMGSPETEIGRRTDEGPQLKVTITKPFYIGVMEVTQKQWKAVMGNNPSHFRGDNLPVEQVSWNDCQEFLAKLSAKNGGVFRLPTEAEWEYVCRAGTTTPFNIGNTINPDQANFDGRFIYGNGSKGKQREKTTSAGTLVSNAWGLYDMHGNVNEWCEDLYNESYCGERSIIDSAGHSKDNKRVCRGGCYEDSPENCRSATRSGINSSFKMRYLGFRVVFHPGVPAQPPVKSQNDPSDGRDDAKTKAKNGK
jgi:formylglycine-generating enzyme required for sulfatase activity